MATTWLGLEGTTAVVTGAGGGIGRGVALELARAGANVAVLDLDGDRAEETAALLAGEGSVQALHRRCDTTDAAQVGAAAAEVRDWLGPVDVLVNNAGIIGTGALMETEPADWQRVLDVNLTGYLLCAREFGADMIERGSGSIVHVSSICATNPAPGLGAYSPSKAAVSMFSRQLAAEWAARGVRSNAVAPGLIRTPLTEASYVDGRTRTAREQAVPLHRIGSPQDIADAVVWLASPRSSYVTGQEILVDGGLAQTLMGVIRSAGLDG